MPSDKHHAFISYVREDAASVDAIQEALNLADIPTWRDVQDMWPGEAWKEQIRHAIVDGAIVFVACFSLNSEQKEVSFQREEILLAIDQLRQRRSDRAWFIPVRLDDIEIPYHEIGAGRTLSDLNWVDIWGDNAAKGRYQLVSGVSRIIGLQESDTEVRERSHKDVSARTFVKTVILEPTKQIELAEFISTATRRVVDSVSDQSRFPMYSDALTNDDNGQRFLADQTIKYWETVRELSDAFGTGAAWSTAPLVEIWRRSLETFDLSLIPGRNQEALTGLARLPVAALAYACALGAVGRDNFDVFRAVVTESSIQTNDGRSPVVACIHPSRIFARAQSTAALALRMSSGDPPTDEDVRAVVHRFRGDQTPLSRLLFEWMRPLFEDLLPSDRAYKDNFDRTEYLLGMVACDLKANMSESGQYADGGWVGQYVYTNRFGPSAMQIRIAKEIDSQGASWPPLGGGLFGSQVERASQALSDLSVLIARTSQSAAS